MASSAGSSFAFGGATSKAKAQPTPTPTATPTSSEATSSRSMFLLDEVLKKEHEDELENRSWEKRAFVEELVMSALRKKVDGSEKDGESAVTVE